MKINYTFELNMSASDYINSITRHINELKREFVISHYKIPEVIYLDYTTYLKIKVAFRNANLEDYQQGLLYHIIDKENKKEVLYFMGLKVIVIPTQNELIELGRNDVEENVDIGLCGRSE